MNASNVSVAFHFLTAATSSTSSTATRTACRRHRRCSSSGSATWVLRRAPREHGSGGAPAPSALRRRDHRRRRAPARRRRESTEFGALMDRFAVLVVRDQAFEGRRAGRVRAPSRRRRDRHVVVGLQHHRPRAAGSDRGRRSATSRTSTTTAGPRAANDRKRMYALGNRLWHTDGSFRSTPAEYSMLTAHSVPSRGGETEFADMRAAYDASPTRARREIAGLEPSTRSSTHARCSATRTSATRSARSSRRAVTRSCASTRARAARRLLASHASTHRRLARSRRTAAAARAH